MNECMSCYMRQMSMTDAQNNSYKEHPDEKIIHICDVCGKEIGRIDNIIYLEPTNRDGTALMSKELCYHCAWTLLNWAGGINDVLPEVPEEDVKFIWRKEETIDVTRVKPHKRKKRKKQKKFHYGYLANGKRYSYAHYDNPHQRHTKEYYKRLALREEQAKKEAQEREEPQGD